MFVSEPKVQAYQTAKQAGAQNKSNRWRLLWAALCYAVTGNARHLTLYGGVSMNLGSEGISAEAWVKPVDAEKWKHLAVGFDGKKAVGYIDGQPVTG